MKKHLSYLKYVLRHKFFVFQGCWEYGLIWRGIKHDWSKFLPSEWIPYVERFNGKGKGIFPDSALPEPLKTEYLRAWNHHQKFNTHHPQYHLLKMDSGEEIPLEMPHDDLWEMIADWRGAGKAQGKPNTWEWYEANKHRYTFGPETRAIIEREMERLRGTEAEV